MSARSWQTIRGYSSAAEGRTYPYVGTFSVSSPFGPRSSSEKYVSKQHYGIDFVGQTTKVIVSCASGVVKIAQKNNGNGYGNYIWIANDDGSACIYAHLKSMTVKAGQRVVMKQQIGVEGSTGNSTGSHLHLGVSTNQDYGTTHANKSKYFVNPATWLGMKSSIRGQVVTGTGKVVGGASAQSIAAANGQSTTSSSSSTSFSGSINTDNILLPSGEYYTVDNVRGVYSDWLYGRKYRIFVDTGSGDAFDVSELRCSFQVTKTAYAQPNQSQIKIYNLSPDTENKLIKQGQTIIIEAGYQGDQYGVIFAGKIVQPIRSKENSVDYVLTLVSMDAEVYANMGLVGVSLVAQQSARDAIDAVTQKATVKQETAKLTDSNITYPRGKVLFGMPKTFLENIATSLNATYFNDDGKVNIVTAKDTADGTILSFGPDSGLIGTPTQTENGIMCKVLLNPRITINSLFHIDNKKVEGYRYEQGKPVRSLDQEGIYRAVKVTHTGDTRGSDWYTEIEAVSQAGLLPGMMSSADVYAW